MPCSHGFEVLAACRHCAIAAPVPLLTKVPAIGAFTDQARAAVKNHSLSFLIGPPWEKLTYEMRSILLGFGIPRSLSSCVKLSDCHSPGRYDAKNAPLNLLPPSRGIMFRRTPPDEVSAPTPLVW